MQYSYTWEWRDDARATRMGLRALAVVVPRQMWVWKKATKTSVISSWMSKYCTVICTAESSKADMNTDISIKGTIKENLRFSSISCWRYTDHHLLLINDSKHLSLFNLIFVLKWLQAKLFVFLSSLWSTAHKQKKKRHYCMLCQGLLDQGYIANILKQCPLFQFIGRSHYFLHGLTLTVFCA